MDIYNGIVNFLTYFNKLLIYYFIKRLVSLQYCGGFCHTNILKLSCFIVVKLAL